MSYKSFDFNLPTRIVFGPHESERAAEYAASLKPSKIMILTYADVMLPCVTKLLADLDAMDIPYALYAECRTNPKAGQIDLAAEFCRKEGCDLVLGVGGGTVIDTAKGTALAAANKTEGGVWEFVSGARMPENRALPIMLIVTIASTGSEGNESFVVTDEADTQKLICNEPSVRPTLSICDPVLSLTLPPKQTALGAIDAFSHLLEQYLHNDTNVEVSDNMTYGVMAAVVKWAPVAFADPSDLDARSNLLWSAILAMTRTFGVGHDENWLCHMLEHAVSARYNITHAAGMAAIMPSYLRFVEKKGWSADKLAAIAALFGAEDAAEGLAAFEKSLGLPVDLKEAVGEVPDADAIRTMADNALPWGPMDHAGYPEQFTAEDAVTLLTAAFSDFT